jgi:hypothetical protein
LPHAPQSSGLVWSCAGERHAPPHVERPIVAQLTCWHTPSTQSPAHAVPHAPQF